MSASDNARGSLNMVFAGDPAQLPPPKNSSLFDHELVKDAEKKLNAGNEKAVTELGGVLVWRSISDCVVLSKIMRQSDSHFQSLLNRLRFGLCSEDDYDL